MVMVDECHAGFIGATGKGTLEAKVMGRVDIITGTLNFRWSHGRIHYSQKIKSVVASAFKTLFVFKFISTYGRASIKVFELLERYHVKR
jgi:hypothetical protein